MLFPSKIRELYGIACFRYTIMLSYYLLLLPSSSTLSSQKLPNEILPLKSPQTTASYNLQPDISEAYVRWSEWQRERMREKLKNHSGTTKVSPNSVIPQTKQSRDLLGKSISKVAAPVTPDKMIHLPQQKVQQFALTNKPPENGLILLQEEYNFTNINITNNLSQFSSYTTTESAIMALLTVIASFITISGNILVLLSFFVERALRTATNYFIASLAVTDVLIGLFSMNLYTLYLILGRWPLGRLSCDLWLSLDYTACLTSQYTVLFITVDRFFSVRIPAKYRNWRTDSKVGLMVAVTWVIPSSVFFTIIIGWPYFNTTVKPRANDKCFAEFANDPIFNTVFTVCYFWVTLCVMIGLYVGIYRVAENLQKRSDEKRNRVSGLITQSTIVNQSQMSKLVNNNQERNKAKLVNAKLIVQGNAGATGTNDSSGFDSDEEQQKRLDVVSNTREGMKLDTTELVNTQRTQPILFTNITPHRPSTVPQNKELISITGSVPVPPKTDRHATVCAEPTVRQPKVNHVEAASKAAKTPQKCKPVTSKNQIECPLHPRRSQSVDQSEQCKQSPSSILIQQKEGLQIASPVLTDDESGVELSGYRDSTPPYYLPPSPALCICSDLEDDQGEDQPLSPIQESPPRKESETKFEEPLLPQTCPTVSLQQRKTNTTKDKVKSNAETPKPQPNSPTKIPPVQQQSDPDYQNRVLEAFRRRIAASNIPVVESRDSDYVTSSNPSSQQQLTTHQFHGKMIDQLSAQNGNPKQRATLRRDGDSSVWNGELRTVDSSLSDVKVIPSSGDADDASVIWKPQPYPETDTYSTGCSLHGLTSYCDQSTFADCSGYHPECVMCTGQNDFDSVRSSSSYGDYVGPHLVERRFCCCTTGLRDERNKKVSFWPKLRKQFSALRLSRDKFAYIIAKMKGSCDRKSNKAQVERGRRENRARKALRTITFILGAFVLCWTPYHIVIIIKGICDDVPNETTCVNDVLYSVTYWLCYMNSPINPFCYALANAQFKKTFSRILHGDFRRN